MNKKKNKVIISWFKGFGLKLCVLLISIAVSLTCAEMVLRIFPRFGNRYRLELYKSDSPNIGTLNEPNNFVKFRPSAIVGYEIIPRSSAEVNSYGLIGREYKIKKSKNVYRILVLGDSITQMDWYVSSLQGRLNNCPRIDSGFEVWNAGVSGYAINQYTNYFKFKGVKYRPDMLIIGFCLNDFDMAGTLITYKNAHGFTGYYYSGSKLERIVPTNRFLFKHSYLYRLLYLSLDHLLVGLNTEKYENEQMETGTEHLREIKSICKSKNIILLGVIFPYLKSLEEYTAYELKEYNSMIKVLEGLGIDYIDLHHFFPKEREKLRALRYYQGDFIHPSREGHELIARTIYNYLIKKYNFCYEYSEFQKEN